MAKGDAFDRPLGEFSELSTMIVVCSVNA